MNAERADMLAGVNVGDTLPTDGLNRTHRKTDLSLGNEAFTMAGIVVAPFPSGLSSSVYRM